MKLVPVLVVLISVVACVTDLRSRRIPNVLTLGGALAALVYHATSGGVVGLLIASSGWIVGLALFFLPYALGGMGGGDVKLLAALGAWLGPLGAVWLALYTGLAGGVLAIGVAWRRGYLPVALKNVWLLLAHWRVVGIAPLAEVSFAGNSGPRLAYAVPILIGTVVTVWLH